MAGRKKAEPAMPTRPICPYFRRAEGTEITCKGGTIPDADDIRKFRDTEKYLWQYHTFCCGSYKRCPGYITIDHWKWDAEDEDE